MKLRALAISSIAVCLWLFAAAPASAHAQLLSTQPDNNAALTTSPTSVTVHFGEDVEIPLGSLRVYNSAGARVDRGTPHHLNGDAHTVAVGVRHLPTGGYVATWRVISADSHPVHGAFTFTVGSAMNNTASLAQKLLAAGKGPTDVGVVYAAFRALLIGSATLAIGALTIALFLAPEGEGVRRSSRVLLWSLLALLAATVGVYALQGVYAATFGLSSLLDRDVLNAVFRTNLGYASMARLALIALFLFGIRSIGFERTRFRRVVWVVLMLALVLTLTLSGHAATGRWAPFAIVADLIHVASAAAWAGGLICMAMIWRYQSEDDLAVLVTRFSSLALIAVSALTVTGVFQSYRQLGSIDALLHTSYGQILIVKVAIVAAMVLLGRVARKSLNNSAHVRRSIRIESALAIGVFVATALLMDATPGNAAVSAPFTGEAKAGNTLVDVIITPDKAGITSVHFYTLSDDGLPMDVADLSATLTLNSRDIGPLPISLIKVAPGHYASYSFNVPLPGKWQLDTTVRTSDVDENIATEQITFR